MLRVLMRAQRAAPLQPPPPDLLLDDSPNVVVSRKYWWATLALVVLYITTYSIFTIGRYERYNATGFDLAFYDQILWRTAHSDIMGMSIEGDNWSNWAFHVEPILLLLAPLKLVFTDVRWLLILQTVALAIAAIPVYQIAQRQFGHARAGLLFAGLYLLYPCVGWANKFDFHPLTLTTPLLLFAFDAAELKRFRLVSILLLLALMCKEEMGFLVACFGLYWYFSPARWRFGLIWAGTGLVWSLLGFFVIIPGAQGNNVLPNQAFLRYNWLFHGSLQDKIAFITGPETPVKIRFLIQLFVPLSLSPLLKPGILFIGSPILALSLLSANMNQSGIYHHYMAAVVPFLMIAAIKGTFEFPQFARRFSRRLRPWTVYRALFASMIVGTVLMFVVFNPFFFVPREPYAPTYGWESGASIAGLQAAEALIPPESCLTTANNIASKYGQRTYIYVVGIGNYLSCDLVLIDMADTRYVSFGSPQRYACDQFRTANFRPIFFQNNVVILRKDAPGNSDLDSLMQTACARIIASSSDVEIRARQ